MSGFAHFDIGQTLGEVRKYGTHINGFVPTFGATIPIIRGTSRTGTFATLAAPALGGNLVWRVRYLTNGADLVATCLADISASSDPNNVGYGGPDLQVDASDFFYFLDQFVAQNAAIADLSGSSDPNDPTYGVPDGQVDASDFFYFLDLFVGGCS